MQSSLLTLILLLKGWKIFLFFSLFFFNMKERKDIGCSHNALQDQQGSWLKATFPKRQTGSTWVHRPEDNRGCCCLPITPPPAPNTTSSARLEGSAAAALNTTPRLSVCKQTYFHIFKQGVRAIIQLQPSGTENRGEQHAVELLASRAASLHRSVQNIQWFSLSWAANTNCSALPPSQVKKKVVHGVHD